MELNKKILNIRINKLYKAWKTHRNLLICCDFDDTLHNTSNEVEFNDIINNTIELLKESKFLGSKITIFTCRGEDEIKFVTDYLLKNNIPFDDINPTTPTFPGYSLKPYCNIMLDDKSGLEESLFILKQGMNKYRQLLELEYLNKIISDDEFNIK